ncbi:MAG TPA: TIM-barrel domain-containing protein [Ktedonobacteraceae bacterium]|jgi:alpha-glucosidase|nr:TIM-barrel domain-containing protein [Ktedonobacteraceae bacterium]
MLTTVRQFYYQCRKGSEHIWHAEETDPAECLLAGAILDSNTIRVRFVRGGILDETRYQLVDGRPGTLPYHSWIVTKGDEEWPQFLDEEQARAIIEPYLHGFSFSSTAIRLARSLASEERIYGLGERTGDMNKRGLAFPVWNVDPPQFHGPQTVTMYTSIPFYLGLHLDEGRAYGILIDHTGLVDMDLGKTNESEATMTIQGDSMVVYFFTGPQPADVMRQYAALTGHMPLPPRWAIGYQQCRWDYKSEEEIRELAAKLRARHHPCDGIWLDIDYMNGYRCFTWDAQRFPDPTRMANELHEQGIHLVTIIDPGIKIDDDYSVYRQGMEHDYFCRHEDGKLFTGTVWPGECVFPDFSRSEVRSWWGNLYSGLLDQGVDGIWNDMNEPALSNLLSAPDEPSAHGKTMSNDVLHRAGGDNPTGPDGPPVLHKFFHNAYGMEMARSTFEGLTRLRPDTRPFVLSRSGTGGVQRYAAIWTGDNTSAWDNILMAIPMCLNLSMSGVPFIGMDIGGFWNASNGELLVRFAQLGALLPFCRNHNATGNPDQEPWAFGEPYESAFRAAIEQRYRLLPYIYTLFHEATAQGTPIMRPLYYHYPNDELACDSQDEFLLGDSLLSAPIYEQGATSRNVYLPAGTWFDYWDGTAYPGSGTIEVAAPLERWPLFVRGNSILPSGPVMQYTDQRPTDPLTITCYMSGDGLASYTLYEDDGSTLAYRKGAFALTHISCRVDSDLAAVEIEEQYEHYRSQREWYDLVVFTGGQIRQQRVRAGQSKVVIRL